MSLMTYKSVNVPLDGVKSFVMDVEYIALVGYDVSDVYQTYWAQLLWSRVLLWLEDHKVLYKGKQMRSLWLSYVCWIKNNNIMKSQKEAGAELCQAQVWSFGLV